MNPEEIKIVIHDEGRGTEGGCGVSAWVGREE
jgi:hypothetical protein